MIEEYDMIDTTTQSEDGSVKLVIMDAGLTKDPEERFEHLINKLRTYVAYSSSDQFREAHPGIGPDRVSILVMCRIPPTRKMLDVTNIARADAPADAIQISYSHFPGADGDCEVSCAPSQEKIRKTFLFYIMIGLALLTMAAALIGWMNAGRNPLPGILVGLFFAALGYVFGGRR